MYLFQGDSGSPLMSQGRRGPWVISGLVSFNLQCKSGPPDIFTKVLNFLPWITLSLAD